jgi:hypothetical protein
MTTLRVPDRDKELGAAGSAAGTLTPSSRRSSLLSGELLHHPTNCAVLGEPVEEKVSRSGVLFSYTMAPVYWALQLDIGTSVLGPTATQWQQCPGPNSYTMAPVYWALQLDNGNSVLGPTATQWHQCTGPYS